MNKSILIVDIRNYESLTPPVSRAQWIVIDAKVYDVSKFKNLHPGGASVFLSEDIRTLSLNSVFTLRGSLPVLILYLIKAGQDVTEQFYGLHRHDVLLRPQYARLQIGTVKDESSEIVARVAGELCKVPYSEPMWLADGYQSPYFTEVG